MPGICIFLVGQTPPSATRPPGRVRRAASRLGVCAFNGAVFRTTATGTLWKGRPVPGPRDVDIGQIHHTIAVQVGEDVVRCGSRGIHTHQVRGIDDAVIVEIAPQDFQQLAGSCASTERIGVEVQDGVRATAGQCGGEVALSDRADGPGQSIGPAAGETLGGYTAQTVDVTRDRGGRRLLESP